ncbi:MAG: hypothetical protein AMS20_08870 [Gemmatimonas sp. SG8_28]|jgi:hypothetical protein|nr:MAG: hypothetical protein AMS20_08870 [Gemmatimonas sp. SG8_28]
MSQRAYRLWLVVLPFAAPLPVLAQAASVDTVAAPRLRIGLAVESAIAHVHDATLLAPVDSVGWKLHVPERTYPSESQDTLVVLYPGVACPMPVVVPAPNATVPMPTDKSGLRAAVPMPTERAGCFNPLFRPR